MGERTPIGGDRIEIDREHAAGFRQRRTAGDSGRRCGRVFGFLRLELTFLHRHSPLAPLSRSTWSSQILAGEGPLYAFRQRCGCSAAFGIGAIINGIDIHPPPRRGGGRGPICVCVRNLPPPPCFAWSPSAEDTRTLFTIDRDAPPILKRIRTLSARVVLVVSADATQQN